MKLLLIMAALVLALYFLSKKNLQPGGQITQPAPGAPATITDSNGQTWQVTPTGGILTGLTLTQ